MDEFERRLSKLERQVGRLTIVTDGAPISYPAYSPTVLEAKSPVPQMKQLAQLESQWHGCQIVGDGGLSVEGSMRDGWAINGTKAQGGVANEPPVEPPVDPCPCPSGLPESLYVYDPFSVGGASMLEMRSSGGCYWCGMSRGAEDETQDYSVGITEGGPGEEFCGWALAVHTGDIAFYKVWDNGNPVGNYFAEGLGTVTVYDTPVDPAFRPCPDL